MMTFRDIRRLPGWLAWQDFSILRILVAAQRPDAGALVEIGVHHGKSFLPIATFSGGRKLYAIDLFGRQELNVDLSGQGNKEAFLGNLRSFGVDVGRVTIDERLSNDVTASDILSAVGPVGFFHIDGGHHLAAVSNDLKLARETVGPAGIIAIDDTYRPEWPEVTQAVFADAEFQRAFRQFAIGFNKSYWCRREFVEVYQRALRADPDLQSFLRKTYWSDGVEVLIYQDYPLPEWSVISLTRWLIALRMPSVALRLGRSSAAMAVNSLRRRVRRALSR